MPHLSLSGRTRRSDDAFCPKASAAAAVAVVALAALVVAGCTKGEVAELPPAPSLPQTTTTTTPDLSGVALAAAPGRTTTTVAMGPGQATITGTIAGPEGAVAGAVIRAERLVGDGVASTDFLSNPDGTFALPQILGGRYRVRAWKPAPDNLAMTTPQVFFLEGRESKVLNLVLERHQGVGVTANIAPNPPTIDDPANLVVLVVNRQVDAEGIVRSEPVAGVRVELFGTGDWRLTTANPTTTDGNGRAQWTVVCRRAGDQPLSVVVADTETFPLQLPPCSVRSFEEPTTTAAPSATTTTTR